MKLHGANLLGSSRSSAGTHLIYAANPATGQRLEPGFHQATPEEVDRAMMLAESAFRSDGHFRTPDTRARLLETIAAELEALGDELIQRAQAETGLPEARLKGERQRTVSQLRMFAELVREGSWVDARIDRAIPERSPIPKPDIRRMLLPLGPVVIFGASNFPLAFSVAGGDTASALAAGCPVTVKAHPAHPGTSELAAEAIRKAVEASGLDPGTFSMVHGSDPEVSIELVRHPATAAVGFTGSHRAGRSIFDAACSRPQPIPVYAEMGSVNPVFVLPGALAARPEEIGRGLVQSVCLGVGQFCTNPGLVFGLRSEAFTAFARATGQRMLEVPAGIMLHRGIRDSYRRGLEEATGIGGVQVAGAVKAEPGAEALAGGAVLMTDDETFLQNPVLAEEIFGPSTLIVQCSSVQRLEQIIATMKGNLTATVHGTERDLSEHRQLLRLLEEKVGRIVFNGYPTGVEVCPSMHHGGPYPATTDPKFTSVGTAAIYRFARPVCYQSFPQSALPDELRDDNPRGIWRQVDGKLTKEAV